MIEKTKRQDIRAIMFFACLSVIGISIVAYSVTRPEEHGQQEQPTDTPIKNTDDSDWSIIDSPEGLPDFGHTCDGYGHRVFINTAKEMVVANDPTCGPGGK
jgi:hypothetical protein